jgi:hypothetical protein
MPETIKPFFIYFRHSPKGLGYICSYELKPKGVKKVPLTLEDPNYGLANHIMRMVSFAVDQAGGYNPKQRPDMKAITSKLTSVRTPARVGQNPRGMLQAAIIDVVSEGRYKYVVYLPAEGDMAERLMLVPNNSQS